MTSKLKITIPKPCHENWNDMTPKEKGRFCGSCAKTVVDFTKKSTAEIQDYLINNKNKKVCGHFYKKQLDTITIEIPQSVFQQQMSFQKLFILTLLFVMGTTLFSCQYTDGKKQRIENIVLIDPLKKMRKEVELIIPNKDSINTAIKRTSISENIATKGEVIEVIETSGEITIDGDIEFVDPFEKNEEVEDETVFEITDGLITTEGEIMLEETLGFIIIEESPRFKEAENISKLEMKDDFEKKMSEFVVMNFDKNIGKNIGLSKGKYKIITQFTIDKTGNVMDIKVRAPHKVIEKEVLKILQKLPQFIPGKQRNNVVDTKYTLPISFIIE